MLEHIIKSIDNEFSKNMKCYDIKKYSLEICN